MPACNIDDGCRRPSRRSPRECRGSRALRTTGRGSGFVAAASSAQTAMSISSSNSVYRASRTYRPPRLRGDDSDRDVCLAELCKGRRRSRDCTDKFSAALVRLLEAVDQRLELRRVRAQSRPDLRARQRNTSRSSASVAGKRRPSTASVDSCQAARSAARESIRVPSQSNRTAVIVRRQSRSTRRPRSDRKMRRLV